MMTIAFGFDAEYIPHVAATLQSISKSTPSQPLRLLMLHFGIPCDRQKLVNSIIPAATFQWIEVSERDIPFKPNGERISRSTFFRLSLPNVAPPDCNRIIYLDSDLIVLQDLSELWREDLGSSVIGAVPDDDVNASEFARIWNLEAGDADYFNAGVLLIDLYRVRKEGLFDHAVELVRKHGDSFRYNDQDALNVVCWSRWSKIDPGWNTQALSTIKRTQERRWIGQSRRGTIPKIVHFTGHHKPWVLDDYHPWSWIYWSALSETPFFMEVAAKSKIRFGRRFRLWMRWIKNHPKKISVWKPS